MDPEAPYRAPRLAPSDWLHLSDPLTNHLGSNDPADRLVYNFLLGLKRRFRSLRQAWDKVLDPDEKGQVTMTEFSDIMERILNYRGERLRVFRALDIKKRGFLELDDLNPRGAEVTRDIRFRLVNRFGAILSAFHPFQVGTSEKLDFAAFSDMLSAFETDAEAGYKVADMKAAFDWLDYDGDKLIEGRNFEVAAPQRHARMQLPRLARAPVEGDEGSDGERPPRDYEALTHLHLKHDDGAMSDNSQEGQTQGMLNTRKRCRACVSMCSVDARPMN